jgi:thiamine-monophosphate kinase
MSPPGPASGQIALGPGGEFDRIRAIIARLGPDAGELGDDCALVPLGGTILALSIDASVEDVHFRTDWLTFREIGWRAAAAALSDLAADGVQPLGVLVSLGVPDHGKRSADGVDGAAEIMTGVGAAAHSVGAKVLGGDLVRADKYLVDVCVLGTVERPVRRAGARPGDGLWVTGTLGGAGLALHELTAGGRPDPDVMLRFAHPVPRIAAGRWLAAHGATAMIDLSDGLAGDAAHLAAASGVGIEIALERVPSWLGVEPLLAAASGEEYELLVALPPAFGEPQAKSFRQTHDLPLTRIGACLAGGAGPRGVRFTDRGAPAAVPGGYDHFPRG